MNQSAVWLLAIGFAGWMMLNGTAGAEDATSGRAAYLQYCSSCHGEDGRGDGVVSSMMRPKPADLTRLAAAHGGTFPFTHVEKMIDGRQRPAAHGSSEMPVWGEVLSGEKAMAQPSALVRGQVQEITSYLASIQAK